MIHNKFQAQKRSQLSPFKKCQGNLAQGWARGGAKHDSLQIQSVIFLGRGDVDDGLHGSVCITRKCNTSRKCNTNQP